jgi:hypothetical protein
MDNALNIYYVLICEFSTKYILDEVKLAVDSYGSTKGKEIFNYKINQRPNINVEHERKKIINERGNSCFYYYADNEYLIFIETDNKLPERYAYKLLDIILQDNIQLMTNDRGDLNKNGKKKLRNIVAKFQDSVVINSLQTDIDDIHLVQRDSTDAKIQDQSNKLYMSINKKEFKKCRHNCKTIITLILIIVVLLIVIILPIVLSNIKGATRAT